MRSEYIMTVGALALTVALDGPDAFALGSVTAPLVDYNSALVAIANGMVTVPFGALVANAVYTVAAGTDLDVGSRFTVTLPPGFLFQSEPGITGPGATTFTLVAGGIGANSVTFQIADAAVPAGGTVSIGAFAMSGASVLESAFGGNSLPMTFQSTNNAAIGNNDPAPLSVPVFNHAVGSLPDTITPGTGFINLNTSPPGTAFIPGGATVAGSALVAVFAINTELQDPFNANAPVLSADGLANSLNPTDTVNITVEGNFTGIATAYADPTIGTCADTAPAGAVAGVVTSGDLSFSGIPINTPVQICMIPDGVTLMQPGTTPYVFTYGTDHGTDFFGGLAQTTANNFYTYTGGTAQSVTNFFTGTDAGYSTVLRVNNAGKSAASVIAEFQPYSGGDLLIGDLGTIAPGTGTVFTLAQIESLVPGLSLIGSGQRATLTVIGTGVNTNVSASAILISPGGLVDNVQ
jgi:hypothetical protein